MASSEAENGGRKVVVLHHGEDEREGEENNAENRLRLKLHCFAILKRRREYLEMSQRQRAGEEQTADSLKMSERKIKNEASR